MNAVEMLGESRYAGTVDLLVLYATAAKLGLNRNLPDGTAMNLDPNGNHVFTVALVDHQAHPARQLPTHHRVSTLVKLRDDAKPFCVFLDVTAAHWERLYTWDETKALAVEGERLRLPPRLFETLGANVAPAKTVRVEVVS